MIGQTTQLCVSRKHRHDLHLDGKQWRNVCCPSDEELLHTEESLAARSAGVPRAGFHGKPFDLRLTHRRYCLHINRYFHHALKSLDGQVGWSTCGASVAKGGRYADIQLRFPQAHSTCTPRAAAIASRAA